MMEQKSIVATWLFRTDLSNLNAGEGTSNLKEIKTYNNGLPYVSGQSVRHALRKAIQREHPNEFKCTPEMPCGDIANCWLCDMFGYLLPGEGEKRWSPVKASPAMGQVRKSVTTDLILRLVGDIECPNCKEKINPLFRVRDKNDDKNIKKGSKIKCPKCEEDFEAPYDIRQAIAYKQLIDNIYRVSVALDINALGIHEVPKIDGTGEGAKITAIEYKNKYLGNAKDVRKARVIALLDAISNISDFANQSREMTNTSPDIVLISVQGQYNHRLASALRMNEEGEIEVDNLTTVLKDVLKIPNTTVYAGMIKGTLKQDDEKKVVSALNSLTGVVLKDTPRDAINAAKAHIQ